MAGDNRGTSSLFRRAEQLRRWQESETNKQVISENRPKKRKVKFSDGCIFLAAGAAGDKDELKRLLDRGADINTVNQDGITALHAACIDNNLELVEFLVDNHADINRCDMEGWTPLHATASCGSLSMAEFLMSRGSDLSLVNNDGELAIDVVDEEDMAQLLQEEMDKRGVDCDASRKREEMFMLQDLKSWLSAGTVQDAPHPKTGASALHVAAAKGYMKVIRLLIDLGVDADAKDFDGWTPLHAAAHWGQTEAVEVLCESLADMEAVNNVGQTAYDLADDAIKPLMDELARKQASTKLINKNRISAKKRKSSPLRKDSLKKKEKESSDGTSADESSEHEEENKSGGKSANSVDHSEIQSWRRPSLKNKPSPEDKSSKKDAKPSATDVSLPNHNDDEVVLRKHSREQRNCQDVLKVSENHLVTSTSSLTTSTSSNRSLNRSFAPPSRDEESETQRKAHAKMVRSTRRSTQGITLEDLKSAEQYIKCTTKASTSTTTTAPVVATTLTSALTVITSSVPSSNSTPTPMSTSAPAESVNSNLSSTNPPTYASSNKSASSQDSSATHNGIQNDFKRPSWKLKVDTNNRNRFSLETNHLKFSEKSATEDTVTTASLPLKKIHVEDKKDDKNDDKSSSTREGTQAVIQRRKKAKRRSTGVVHVDMDEIDPDRKSDRNDDEGSTEEGGTCPSDREGLSSSKSPVHASKKSEIQNGDLDYKKLYEEQLVENEKLLDRLRICDKDLKSSKGALESQNKIANASAESERREKRGLERKLSEMEEELKLIHKLKSENEKLRAENRALTRVVSKLTNSAAVGGAFGGPLSALNKTKN